MSEVANRWKLGLFIAAGAAAAVSALVMVGALGFAQSAVTYETYFDEAVTGLDRGAQVKLRGVTVGEVLEIGLAPDLRRVRVSYEVAKPVALRLGGAGGGADERGGRTTLPLDLRAQLGSQGVSGIKHIQLDYFDAERYPVAELPFDVPPTTIPAAPSTMASLEASLVRLANDFPRISERALTILEQLHVILAGFETQQVPQRMTAVLAGTEGVLRSLDAKLAALPVRELSAEARATADELRATLVEVQNVLSQMKGERGLVASLQRTSDSIGDMAGRASGDDYQIGETLRDFRLLVETMQGFVDTLERDPDMLLKGRAELP